MKKSPKGFLRFSNFCNLVIHEIMPGTRCVYGENGSFSLQNEAKLT